VCPVKINIPEVLIHLRGKVVEREQETLKGKLGAWNLGMQAAAQIFASGDRLALAQMLGRLGQMPFAGKDGFIDHLPMMLGGWTQSRDAAEIPPQSFRQWWTDREQTGGGN
jgi:L-lactate dehydrogenase complex protein LldF